MPRWQKFPRIIRWSSLHHLVLTEQTKDAGTAPRDYMVFHSTTHEYVLDYQQGDILLLHGRCRLGYQAMPILSSNRWPMAPPRLCLKASTTYRTPWRFWEVCEKHKMNILYSAPTAIRSPLGSEINMWKMRDPFPARAGFGG
jgi:Acyl-coenzyme A synthetases/AMP-(fatty) acid ligases